MKDYIKPEVEIITYQVVEDVATGSGTPGWQESSDFELT